MRATSNQAILKKTVLPAVLLAQCCAVPVCRAQAPAPNVPALEIALEQQIGGKAVPMPPTHVFDSGDTIRFRVTSRFDGYIYVMDEGTSGKFATAFPSATAGSDNQIHLGQSYLIPSTVDGWFQVSGPAGFDVLYFLLSPEPIVTPAAASLAAPGAISSLKPRCNDAAFRARGECLDITAGPAPMPRDAPLPAPLALLAGAASRDITVTKKKDSVTITSGSNSAPVIYTFRLAHN